MAWFSVLGQVRLRPRVLTCFRRVSLKDLGSEAWFLLRKPAQNLLISWVSLSPTWIPIQSLTSLSMGPMRSTDSCASLKAAVALSYARRLLHQTRGASLALCMGQSKFRNWGTQFLHLLKSFHLH